MNLEPMETDNMDYKEAFKVTDVSKFKDTIACDKCCKLLNIAPIYCLQIDEEDDGSIILVCGRCLHITERHTGKKWRQISYEHAAKFMTFPCSFKNEGCDLILSWNKILDHETGCINALVNCPATENEMYTGLYCPWKGNTADVDKHVEDIHTNSILDPPYFEQLPRTSEIYFTHVNTKLAMIVFLKQDDRKYYCCIFINTSDIESQFYRYQIELRDESKENSIILRKNRLEPFGNLQAILANKEKLLEINLDAIEPMVKQNEQKGKRISARFGVVLKNKKEILQVAEANGMKISKPVKPLFSAIKNLPPDESMLSELECPVCNEFMIPPIYICNNGHSLCNECLEKVQSCPNCRSSLDQKTRNFTLEKLTTKVCYPCKNREIGCGVATTSDKIREHEKTCELTETPCILKCGEKFRKPALYNHLNEVHSDNILKLDVIQSRDVHERKESNFAIYAFGDIFRISIKGGLNIPYRFNLQQMAKEHQDPQYRFKLEIIDKSDLELNITIMNVVQPLTENPIKSNPLTIPWDFIKQALVDSKFCYRINMFIIKKRK